jgi:excisionase family DNA binding protein
LLTVIFSEAEMSDEQVKRPLRRPTMPGLVTCEDLALLLGASKAKLYELAKRKQIPCVRIGDRVLFRVDAVVTALSVPAESEGTSDRPLVVRTKGRRQAACNE